MKWVKATKEEIKQYEENHSNIREFNPVAFVLILHTPRENLYAGIYYDFNLAKTEGEYSQYPFDIFVTTKCYSMERSVK